MFLFRLVSFLFGYVGILVRGENLEKFLNMAASRGIFLWDIKKVGRNEIFIKTRLSAVRPLRHIGRSTRIRFAFKDREGLPFMISRIRKRKSIVIGAVLFLLGLYVLSSFVWVVEVKGNRSITSGEILDIAARAGLKVGSLKLRVDEERVEEFIRRRLPEVSYVGVNVSGARVTIEIAEKIIMQKKEAHPSDIVAGKSGLIKEVLVLVGNPAVKEGDTVVPGQVLISGVIPPPEMQSPNPQGTYVKARGVVRARVWYDGYGEAPLQEEATRETGRRLSSVRIKIGDKEIIISGAQNIPFGSFRIERSVKKPPGWRNLSIPVELISEDYFEVENYRMQRSRIEALDLAAKKALESARSGMNNIRGEYHVFEEKTGEISSKNPENIVRVRAYIETLEDIGVEKPIK